MTDVLDLRWPTTRFGEALTVLGRRAELISELTPSVATPIEISDTMGSDHYRVDQWIANYGAIMGIDVAPNDVRYANLPRFLASAGPALLQLCAPDSVGVIALLGVRRNRALIVAPDLRVHRVPFDELVAALRRQLDGWVTTDVEFMLGLLSPPARRRAHVRAALLGEVMGTTRRIFGCWTVRLPVGAAPLRLARTMNLPTRGGVLLGAHLLRYGLEILGWLIIGRAVFSDRIDPGWMLAWALIMMTMVPVQMLTSWLSGTLAIGGGMLLKRRLMAGALALPPEAMRQAGIGQLLGTVLEADAVENLALSGGLQAALAIVEIAVTVPVLAAGASGPLLVIALLVWLAFGAVVIAAYFRRRMSWTSARLTLTHEFVEQMNGHATRRIQESPTQRHLREDSMLRNYSEESAPLDRLLVWIVGMLPEGWTVLGLVTLIPVFGSGRATSTDLAVALGGVLLANRGLHRGTNTVAALANTAAAWRRIGPIAKAAAFVPPIGEAEAAVERRYAPGETVLETRSLAYEYGARAVPVLRALDITIRSGEHILLEGDSGSGKSTLASVLAGLKVPTAGTILLGGLDYQTLGRAGWIQQVAFAPQFHDNHIFSGTLAFNLLMGRRWPATESDLAEAEDVCRALDLGPLLDRMPAGIQQTVGETGWQLSHGERSRVFIARTILQKTEVAVLDESIAALDPETRGRVIACVLERVPTVVVIAHL